jgi:sugar/nucleoside kinase (ribokinase family)
MLNKNPYFGCKLLGCIGNDSYGKTIQGALEKAGVEPLLEISKEHKSSRCACAIFLRERCLMPQIRASTHLSMDFVNKNIDKICESELLYVEGYFVIEKYDIVQHLVKAFHEKNKQVAFTLSATFMVENFYERMLEIANQSHFLVCNNEEATAFSKCTSSNMEDVALAIHKLLMPMNRLLIITCGKEPTVLSRYNYEQQCFDFVLKSYVYPLSVDEIVDTNGAGDGIYLLI